MIARRSNVVLHIREGLHALPCSRLARLASRFASRIVICTKSRRADARSILELLALLAGEDEALDVEAHGPDAAGALDAVCACLSGAETPHSI